MESQRVLIIKVSVTEVDGFPPLPQLQQEVLAISRNHEIVELSEPVRRKDILRTLLDNEPFDIIHFAGHLCEDGFVASEEIIPLDMIVIYIQTGKPKMVFFNTCQSEKVAEMVASRCPADCIFTISDIDNQDAIDFSTMFYSVLRSPDVTSYKESRDRVDPTGIYFRYIPGRNVVVRRGDEITSRIDALERAVGGSRLGEWGLVQKQNELERKQLDIERKQEVVEMWIRDEARPALSLIQNHDRGKGLLWAILAVSEVAALGIAGMLLYLTLR